MNLPPGVTPQLLNSLGIAEGPITNQVFVANVSAVIKQGVIPLKDI